MAHVQWVKSPTGIADEIARRSGRVQQRLTAAAYQRGEELENNSRNNARWNDRTGNARAGIQHIVEASGDVIEIAVGHEVEYGVYLELGTSRMPKLGVMAEEADRTAAAYARDAAEIVRSEFGS